LPASPGVVNPPAARFYNIGDLAEADLEPVDLSPSMNVSATGIGNENLAAVYGMDFAQNFTGGLRVAKADLDGDGYTDLITAPGPLATGLANTFGESLLKVGIFNGNPAGEWTTASIDLSSEFGEDYTGGFLVAVGDVERTTGLSSVAAIDQVLIAPSASTGLFNGVAVYNVAPTERGGKPTPVDVTTTETLAGTITGLTTGAFAGPDDQMSIGVATTANGVTTVGIYNNSLSGFQQQSSFTATLALNEGDGAEANVFRNGASLEAADLNGDFVDELVVGSGFMGMSNFRVIAGPAVIAGNQVQINNALGTNTAPFSSIMIGGRFNNFVPPPGVDPAQQQTNLDFYLNEPVPPFTGLGFNAPLVVQAIESDGDGSAEILVTFSGINSTGNLIKRFSFVDDVNPADRWSVLQGLRATDLGTDTFHLGEGLWLG
ncbi:MAG: hypothetical protein EBU59_12280, partial [Planctomycetia bacterium]|nr:hypothetical protein [Planctomycetia bacterium]